MLRLTIWLSVLHVLAVPMSLHAGNLIPLTIDQLVQHSELVLYGTVLGTNCQQDTGGRIYTRVELNVAEVWKGTVTKQPLSIVHGGGTFGEKRVTVSDQVDFQPGEEVVVFLVINPRGEAVSLGMSQGKFHIWTDRITKQKYARNPFHGGDRTPDGVSTQSSTTRPQLTLTGLKQRVTGDTQ
jgi:hypothetical protein